MDGRRPGSGSGQWPLIAPEGLRRGDARAGVLFHCGMAAGNGISQVQGAQGGNFPQGTGSELGFEVIFQRKNFPFNIRVFRITQFSAFRVAHSEPLGAEFAEQVWNMTGIQNVINMAEGIRLFQGLDKIAVDIKSGRKGWRMFHGYRRLVIRLPTSIPGVLYQCKKRFSFSGACDAIN